MLVFGKCCENCGGDGIRRESRGGDDAMHVQDG